MNASEAFPSGWDGPGSGPATRRWLAAALGLLLTLQSLAGPTLTTRSESIRDKQPRIEVNVSYLQVGYPSHPEVEKKLNALLKADAEKLVADFGAEYERGKADLPPETPPWSLDGESKVVYQSPRLLCLRQSGYMYEGGAHGMPLVGCVILDLKTGAQLQQTDLFKPGAKYLKVLSDFTRKELMANKDLEDKDWIQRGTAPSAENFPVVCPTARGLLVVFPPYQVGPYAIGMPEVLVPYSAVAPLLPKDGPLGPR